MVNISINVQEPYYSFILQGKKTIEGRLNKGKFATIQVGDILELELEKIKFIVVGKNIYKNFREMIEKEGIVNVIPEKNSIDEAVDVYYIFYTKEQENEFGVVAIKIKKGMV
ncbi:MAG: ASCH domain-containing protein [Candidatus Paceibacterota bacterium]